MKKEVKQLSIRELRTQAPNISFPEYQRESTVWNQRAQQRLLDSIIRGFDISAFYFYRTKQGELECIDGRQRITAILAFTGELDDPEKQNPPFALLFENEIAPEEPREFQALSGATYDDLMSAEKDPKRSIERDALRKFNEYKLTAVVLSDSKDEFEFNLQFTRLNLGVIINAGEKLHAMQGEMRDFCFKHIGAHNFLAGTSIPTRRYAPEVVAAQILAEIFSLKERDQFCRARHVDLQKFFKDNYKMNETERRTVRDIDALLSKLDSAFGRDLKLLRSRALTVSLVLLAWSNPTVIDKLPAFWRAFMDRLDEQLEKIRDLQAIAEKDHWLIEFQKHVTQAAVEKPAIERRHQTLQRVLQTYLKSGKIQSPH